MIKILITGSNGFIGRNLIAELSKGEGYELLTVDIDTSTEDFIRYIGIADFVVHLAGVNRPRNETEFQTGNAALTEWLVEQLSASDAPPPLLITSSIQSDLDNAYGVSKRKAENAVFRYGMTSGAPVYVFKLPNLFGKWSRPNYNSVVATFCYNASHGIPIEINDPSRELTLCYIDDLLCSIKNSIAGKTIPGPDGYCAVEKTYQITVGELADRILEYPKCRDELRMPALDGLEKALYSTYLSYLEPDDFSYPLNAHSDPRGSFYEFFKTGNKGQFSVSTTEPGITRGNHWHHTKVEKFLVIHGEAVIRFRKILETEVIEYRVSGENPMVVDIPVGYTHSITNCSKTETLVTLIWANEEFDPENPDTFFEEV